MEKLLKQYLNKIYEKTKSGDQTEGSYYSAVEDLFTDYPLEKGRKTKVTILPKKTEAGNPDFRVWDGDNFIVGYIEAKTPGINLDQVETSEQLQRYIHTFPNVILTDFYEFRLYRDGVHIDSATIARYHTAKTLKTKPTLQNIDDFERLANAFFSFKLPKSFNAESLATQLAKRTRFLRDIVFNQLEEEIPIEKGDLYNYYQAFKRYLITSLTPQSFADLYAQTITYGMFAARTRNQHEFTRKNAVEYVPHTTGILSDLFEYISYAKSEEQITVTIDDIAAVLNVADINSILDQYYKQGKGEDPIMHFYETFLNQYDPSMREKRGVYYTPESVVKYIVRSVHEILKTDFNMPDGLANKDVTLLDPAAGTLTFPAEAIKLAVETYVNKYGEGGKDNFIRKQILPNFFAFELMMAPYAIGHMKVAYLLESLGFQMKGDDAFKLYLTNTLEMDEIEKQPLPFVASLSEESHKAGEVKREPVLVILGNPPYSGTSANVNDWTEELLKTDIDGAQSYYKVDGNPLGERNPKMLQDDYVKFLRFAQWKIQKAGKGIVAMITNHAWLENPTFRGMRQSMMNTFDKIYILDLHGNSLKKETAPDGSKDENVFDIRVGTAISVFVKEKHIDQTDHMCEVYHGDLFGLRIDKYSILEKSDISKISWNQIEPNASFYLFAPLDYKRYEIYKSFHKLTDLFIVSSMGIKTHRDNFVIDIQPEKLTRRIKQFSDLDIPDDIIRQTYSLKDNRDWSMRKAREALSKNHDWQNKIMPIFYRPFDSRTFINMKELIDWPKNETMKHMRDDNIALISVRQSKTGKTWQHAFIGEGSIECCIVSAQTSEAGYVFPLYLYPDNDEPQSHLPMDGMEDVVRDKTPNIYKKVLQSLQESFGKTVTPEAFLYYVYAVLYSSIYREKYYEYLKIDFPRIPFTSDYTLFIKMAELGERLKNLHLMTSDELNEPVVRYQGQGEDIVKFRRYNEDEKRLFINENKYFENLEPEIWEYQIGGYQVLDKYLKDRSKQKLESPRHVIRIATALSKTIEIQAEIDELYPDVEKDLIEIEI
ncbi:MAG TPA: N-6 DNA methylase [Anaerolineaceae bacterium]|nr:N-6 DNA methylase [Anaerolineaceae bacterium]